MMMGVHVMRQNAVVHVFEHKGFCGMMPAGVLLRFSDPFLFLFLLRLLGRDGYCASSKNDLRETDPKVAHSGGSPYLFFLISLLDDGL